MLGWHAVDGWAVRGVARLHLRRHARGLGKAGVAGMQVADARLNRRISLGMLREAPPRLRPPGLCLWVVPIGASAPSAWLRRASSKERGTLACWVITPEGGSRNIPEYRPNAASIGPTSADTTRIDAEVTPNPLGVGPKSTLARPRTDHESHRRRPIFFRWTPNRLNAARYLANTRPNPFGFPTKSVEVVAQAAKSATLFGLGKTWFESHHFGGKLG